MSEDYFKAYCNSRNAASDTRSKIFKNHIHHYEVLEELMGFQYSLNNRFAASYQNLSNKEEIIKKYSESLLGGVLFTYNIQFLQLGLESVELDYIHIAASNIRSVFEGIPKMFYLSLYPDRVFPIMVHEFVKGLHYENAKNLSGKDKAYKKLIHCKILPFYEENSFNKFKKKYQPSWIRKQLYDSDEIISKTIDKDIPKLTHLQALQSLYDKLSDSSHANLLRNMIATEYDPVNTNFFFEMLKSLSYWNIYAFLEIHYNLLRKMNLFESSINFLNEIRLKYPTMTAEKSFKPTISHLQEKLNIIPVKSQN